MIVSFKHKGLEKFFISGSAAGIQVQHEKRLQIILARLKGNFASTSPKDMNLPGLRLHELKGKRKGTWTVNVSGNWRVTFKFRGVDVIDVNYEDYH